MKAVVVSAFTTGICFFICIKLNKNIYLSKKIYILKRNYIHFILRMIKPSQEYEVLKLLSIQMYLGLFLFSYCIYFEISLFKSLCISLLGSSVPIYFFYRKSLRYLQSIQFELPFFLNLFCSTINAGLDISPALEETLRNLPQSALKKELFHLEHELSSGQTRTSAFLSLYQRVPLFSFKSIALAVEQAEHSGISLGKTFLLIAHDLQNHSFLEAEKSAQKAPIKMLAPLVLCIFPVTFIFIFSPFILMFFS